MSLLSAPHAQAAPWLRRARPLLGTIVDIGVPAGADQALLAAFEAVEQVQRCMSVFESGSDLSRSHVAAVGEPLRLHPWTAEVLRLAHDLYGQTGQPAWREGRFDVALGSGPWTLQGQGDDTCLVRLSDRTRFDLGGLAKGWAVDKAVDEALRHGASAIWVNAGGDLRVQGLSLPIALRHEADGGVQPWAELQDGAVATSDFRPGARSSLSGPLRQAHLSVIAPRCAWADALTKILAQQTSLDSAEVQSLLRHYQAQVCVHDQP